MMCAKYNVQKNSSASLKAWDGFLLPIHPKDFGFFPLAFCWKLVEFSVSLEHQEFLTVADDFRIQTPIEYKKHKTFLF